MAAVQLNVSLSINGVNTARQDNIETDSELTVGPVTLAAAVAGTLTTRTDANTGVVTVAAGHGITASDFVAVGWTDSEGRLTCRMYCDVTAVTATTISIDLGAGTDLPALATEVTVGIVTNEFFHIDPQADSVDKQLPVTALTCEVAAAGQKVAAFYANATDVAGGTLTNGHLVVADGPTKPSILWGALGGFSGFDVDVDRIYLAPLSTTAPVVTAKSMFNT